MEDWNMLAADCIVISCCCQCLILQLVIYILFKLPSKLVRRTAEYVKKKLRDRKQAGRSLIQREMGRYVEEFMKIHNNNRPPRESLGGLNLNDDDELHGTCIKEVESVLEDLSHKGEFGFGSFWRGEAEEFPVCFRNYDFIESCR